MIARLQRRDEAAIPSARRKYGAYCRSIADRLLPSAEDCEEVVSDTWYQMWTSIPPQHPKNLKLYLAAITRNLAMNRRAKNTAEKRGGTELDAVLEELEQCLPSAGTPEETVLGRELERSIQEFLKTCSSRERDVFLRRYFFTEEIPSIAGRYCLREGNVRMILSRTRKKLKKHLMKEGYLA